MAGPRSGGSDRAAKSAGREIGRNQFVVVVAPAIVISIIHRHARRRQLARDMTITSVVSERGMACRPSVQAADRFSLYFEGLNYTAVVGFSSGLTIRPNKEALQIRAPTF